MIITVAGGKGGTGKSFVASSLAYAFSQMNLPPLLVDADAECPNLHLLLGMERREEQKITQVIPKWNREKCIQCGKCAAVCKQRAIAFVPGKFPAFLQELCIGCRACMVACPVNAIEEDQKEIGTIFSGNHYGIELISGELKLGELASGEVVSEVRKYAEQKTQIMPFEITLIDAAAGVGCPVIASLVGADHLVAVTEPTPSALHDLKRLLFLAEHFKIPRSIVINKYDLEKTFCQQIEIFSREREISILAYLPYQRAVLTASLKMKPVAQLFPKYDTLFQKIAKELITCHAKVRKRD